MKKCTKCNNLFLDEWKIVKLKSESEKQIFLNDNRQEICPPSHFDSFAAEVPKVSPVEVPKVSPVEVPKVSPKLKSFVPDPLKINPVIGLSANMTAKDYHDFLLGR
ncbi:hypothetical protein OAP30_03805 [Nitrosopumilus sp.]|nr:hypothetical protein [Nitrosopumilus sp.]